MATDSSFDVFKIPALHVLVADDNAVNQRIMCSMLHTLGHRSVVCEDGLQTLERLQHERFDLLLLDVTMPQMDGLAVLARLRALTDSLNTHTPVVMVTAHAMWGDEEKMLSAGASGYVSKPVGLKALKSVIHQVMQWPD